MQKGKIQILYIDDEMSNLLGFKASFRFHYDIFIASNSNDALEILNQNPSIHIILSDQRMPDKTGVELFEKILVEHPLPVRMLLTAFTDIEAVIEAINRGHIFRYIKKPWDEEDIILAINEAYKYYIANSLLALKNEELKRAYNELDKFAYSVVHDLRGPIMSIRGAIELLNSEDDIEAVKSMLFLISVSAQKLDEFIDSIHEYYKINRGDLKIEKIDFPKLLEDLKSVYLVSSKIDDIKFDTQLEEAFEFRTDLMSLRLILNNLLSNAFKYQKRHNKNKYVQLKIAVEKDKAIISVKDNGIGINKSYINQIFDMFYRATSDEFGSGFGLYNVNQVLKKIEGEIGVSSEEDEGTEFKVIIPTKK